MTENRPEPDALDTSESDPPQGGLAKLAAFAGKLNDLKNAFGGQPRPAPELPSAIEEHGAFIDPGEDDPEDQADLNSAFSVIDPGVHSRGFRFFRGLPTFAHQHTLPPG